MNQNWPRKSHFLQAPQEEIDVHFRWIAEDLNLAKIEREVLEAPNLMDRARAIGMTVVKAAAILAGR